MKQTQARIFKTFYRYFSPLDIALATKHFLWNPKNKKGNLLFPDGSTFIVESECVER